MYTNMYSWVVCDVAHSCHCQNEGALVALAATAYLELVIIKLSCLFTVKKLKCLLDFSFLVVGQFRACSLQSIIRSVTNKIL